MIFLSTLITLAFSMSSGSAFRTATIPSTSTSTSTSYREYLSKLKPVKAELEAVKETKQRPGSGRLAWISEGCVGGNAFSVANERVRAKKEWDKEYVIEFSI